MEQQQLTEAEKLHLSLSEKLGPQCSKPDCVDPAKRIRFWPNPVWGYEPDRSTENSEAGFLLDAWDDLNEPGVREIGFSLDQVRPFCLSHFTESVPAERATSRQPDKLGDSGAGPSDNVVKLTQQRRKQVIADLGAVCLDCGSTDADEMQVVLKVKYPRDWWASLGLSNWGDKYEALASDPSMHSLVDCVCGSCASLRVSGTRTARKVDLRQRVIDGYGGKCATCLNPVDSRTAWLVRRSGTPMLKHGESGRKLTSRQKYERLLKLGCPAGWELRCIQHQSPENIN